MSDFVSKLNGVKRPLNNQEKSTDKNTLKSTKQGVLSETDLAYMVSGRAEIGGQGASLNDPGPQTDWLIDIVDPKWGDWNAFAHDRRKLKALHARCMASSPCPLNELRLGGSDNNLFVRFYEELPDEE